MANPLDPYRLFLLVDDNSPRLAEYERIGSALGILGDVFAGAVAAVDVRNAVSRDGWELRTVLTMGSDLITEGWIDRIEFARGEQRFFVEPFDETPDDDHLADWTAEYPPSGWWWSIWSHGKWFDHPDVPKARYAPTAVDAARAAVAAMPTLP